MFAYIVILILWLPVLFFTSTLESLFSTDELTEMGIRLEDPEPAESPLRAVS